MNTTASALLAIGASPVMAHAEEEVADMVGIAKALVINIGTLSEKWIQSMQKAMLQAKSCRVPIVLDPVGAGATPYRTETAIQLLSMVPVAIVRGMLPRSWPSHVSAQRLKASTALRFLNLRFMLLENLTRCMAQWSA